MLDAVVESSKKHLGLLCLEHVGQPHHWEDDEIAFACQIADKIAIAISNRERRKAQAELEFRFAMLSTQQEVSPDGILVVDQDNKIISYNQQFTDLWRIPKALVDAHRDEPVLLHVAALQKDPVAFLAKVKHLYEHTDESTHDELELTDGRIVERHTAPMGAKDGSFYGRIWFFRDITESRHAAQSLRRALEGTIEALAAMVEARDPYTAGHQRRTASLKSFIERGDRRRCSKALCPRVLFVLQTMSGKDSTQVARASIPLCIKMMLAIALITVFQDIVTWVPEILMRK